MKKTIKNVLIVMSLMAMIAVTSCGDDDDAEPGNEWTEAQRTAFIAGCMEGDGTDEGGTEEQCECMYDILSDEYTPTELANLENDQEGIIELAFLSLECFL